MMPSFYQLWKNKKKRLVLGALFLSALGAFVVHWVGAVDWDDNEDGIVDNHPAEITETPLILAPEENETVTANINGSLDISGMGEVDTQIRVFRLVNVSETQLCTADVEGKGLSVAASGADVEIDGENLLYGSIADEIYYDTSTDSSTAWRINSNASWYTEAKNDEADENGICDYQVGDGDADERGGADLRCGASVFPTRALILANSSGVSIFDADTRSFWKKIALSNISRIAVGEGVIYAGTSNAGVKIFDFKNDTFNTVYDTTLLTDLAIDSNTVNAAEFKRIGSNDYLALATALGVELIDITGGVAYTETAVGSTTGVTFSVDNKLLSMTASAVYLSDVAANTIVADDWAQSDISLRSLFDTATPVWVKKNIIGHSQGATELQETSSELSYRYITKDYATVPMTGSSVLGHWANSEVDRSGAGKDLTANNGATTEPSATDAELQVLLLDGNDDSFSSEDDSFNVSGSALTVGMWVKRPTTGGVGKTQNVLMHGTSRDTRDYWLSAGDEFFDYGVEIDPYFFGIRTSSGMKAASVQTTAEADTWEFIVGTYDGTHIKIYRNGALEHAVSQTGNIMGVDEALQIGAGYAPADTFFFDGSVGLPFVAAEAYSADQIEAIYDKTNQWFLAEAKNTIQGTSSAATEVACDNHETNCYVATSDGVTRLNMTNGLTIASSTTDSVYRLAPTNMAPWTCNVTSGLVNGENVVRARAYIGTEASEIDSDDRTFTLLGFIDTGRVNITGTVQNASGDLLEGVSVTFTGPGDEDYATFTLANGTYSVSVPINGTYVANFSFAGYQNFNTSQVIEEDPETLSVTLQLVVVDNGEATGSNAKGKTLRIAGMKREDFKDSDWVPSMTYEESMAQVMEWNKGVAGGPIFDETGRFLGYGHGGRIAVDEFRDNRNMYARLRHFDRQMNDFISQKESGQERGVNVGHCATPSDKVARFVDVKPSSPIYGDIMQMYSLGLMFPDENKRFGPKQPLGWTEFLLATLRGECIGVEDIRVLRKAQMGRIPGVPLGKNDESRVFYTALKSGIITTGIDINVAPTREQALRMLMMVFPLEIDDLSRKSSFKDISLRSPMAPMLVAVKRAGWLKTTRFVGNKFRPEASMTRGMWAAWYSQAYQNRQSTLSQTDVDSYYKDVLNYFRQEEQKEEKDKSKQAYGPQRLSRVSGTERYVVTRAARQKLKDESLVRIQAQTADASRLKHDKTSQRAALWIKDNSKNIRRKEKSTVIRDLKKFDDYKARAKKPVVLDHKSFTPTRVSLENIAFEPTRETLEAPSFGPTREVFDAGKSLQASQLQRRKKFDPTEQKPSAEATGKTQFGTQKEVAPERRRKSFDVVVPSKESSSVAPQSSKAPEVIHESQRRKRFR